MVTASIPLSVKQYLAAARAPAFTPDARWCSVCNARGAVGPWSDIDLIVIAPELDDPDGRRCLNKLYERRAVTDWASSP